MAEIYIHETGIASDVKDAVKRLQYLLNKEFQDIDGYVWIIPNVNLQVATGVRDVDILVMGSLSDDYFVDDIAGFKHIQINSFCSTLEVKSHGADGIFRDGTSLWVRYPHENKNVTQQSEKQKETLKRFLYGVLQKENLKLPYITNAIWMLGIHSADYANTIGMEHANILTADSSISDFFKAIGRQYKLRDNGFIDSFRGYDKKDIARIADLFCAKVNGADTLSLRRMNLLMQTHTSLDWLENRHEPVLVLSGYAGTGKTIMLLQAAQSLSQKGHKCLFLTYNTALITDLQHTIRFMPHPKPNIEMKSMHTFMLSILYANGLWDSSWRLETDFMRQMKLLNQRNQIQYTAQYDYVFIDEAQDWERPIPDVLKRLFRQKHLVIADGVDQFMQVSERADWGHSSRPLLKKCLRQRRNLTIFAQLFANKMGAYWNVEPNHDLPGGRVIILNQYEPEIHRQLISDAQTHGCVEYDLMLLASNSLISDGRFAIKNAYEVHGIQVYDGIDRESKNKIYDNKNALNHECRVYTYESCRGLEAWTTVCLRFDELFTKPHPHDYQEINYSLARNYMLTLWSLIPLTRAIDTLVLVVNPQTEVAGLLDELAREYPDFITYHK